ADQRAANRLPTTGATLVDEPISRRRNVKPRQNSPPPSSYRRVVMFVCAYNCWVGCRRLSASQGSGQASYRLELVMGKGPGLWRGRLMSRRSRADLTASADRAAPPNRSSPTGE